MINIVALDRVAGVGTYGPCKACAAVRDLTHKIFMSSEMTESSIYLCSDCSAYLVEAVQNLKIYKVEKALDGV